MSDPIFDIGRDLQRAYDEGYEQGKADVEQTNVPDKNVGDLISRQAAFIALNKRAENVSLKTRIGLLDAVRVIDELPSVEPERKPGKWIDGKCNRCGTHAPFWEMATTYYCSEYCPKCGAPMEVDG